MSEDKTVKKAFGIEIGDIIWGNYGNYEPTKYEITSILAPVLYDIYGGMYIYIYSQPVIHIGARDIGTKGQGNAGFNTIRQVGNRYFSCMNDEITIQKATQRKAFQLDLFSDFEQTDEPPQYPFQTGVDYFKGAGFVWHCPRCGKDFNTKIKKKLPCSHDCKNHFGTATPIFYFDFSKEITSVRYPSSFLVSLNFQDYQPSKYQKARAVA